jgi:uncharacterized damage-inducible protein DinB
MTYYAARDLASAFRTVRKNTIQIANDIPEGKYGFRATPDTKTVAELLAHIAAGTTWVHKLHATDKRTHVTFEIFGAYMQELAGVEAALTTKAAIVKALETNGAAFATWLESLSEATLAEVVTFPPPIDPPQKSRFEMLLGSKEHEMHHRAQLMVMERMIGITPHITKAREAQRAAATATATAKA